MSANEDKKGMLRIGLVARIVGTILVSILIPLVAGFAHNKNGTPTFNTIQQFAIGCFVFLAITLTTVSYDLAELLRLRRAEHDDWYIRSQADEWLQNIRASFVTLLHEGGPYHLNLFAQYFMRIFSATADDINEAAAKHELRVDELTFGTTDLLIKIMATRGDQTLRLVHSLDARPNNFDFTTWSRSYYTDLTRLAKSKKIKEIRRLFIYSTDDELKDKFSQVLFAFHLTNDGYDFRVLPRIDWNNLVKGLGMHEIDCEIGVWGELLAYTAIRSSAVGMQGVYTCLPRQIGRLAELFDAGWRLAEQPPMSSNPTPVTVADLFTWGSGPNDANGVGRAPPTGLGLTGDGAGQPIEALPPIAEPS